MAVSRPYDAIVIGSGHNGLVAAALLARAGLRVLILERSAHPGGATVSAAPFQGVDARLSRYSYLVSLFPRALQAELGLSITLRRRRISSYTPCGDAGVLVCDDEQRTRASIERTLGSGRGYEELHALGELTATFAPRVFDSLGERLLSRAHFQTLVGDGEAWQGVFEAPLSELLERRVSDDLLRGIVATDALIGTFAPLDDERLRQNRCFLYHVIGNGTGRWDVPVGGMGAISEALLDTARRAGAELQLHAPVVGLSAHRHGVEVTLANGDVLHGRHALAAVAPAVLREILGGHAHEHKPEGSQLKLNLLLARLPRLRDRAVAPEEAFAGTFHVNEGYDQLATAFAEAQAGQVPSVVPCEAYCHSLTDPSILSPAMCEAGVQTLTVFALHMPARLFEDDPEAAKEAAVRATLRSIDSVLAEPIEDCLLWGPTGEPCLEARTPVELEHELAMPGGHIFHRDLSWPYAEKDHEVGRWGVETEHPNVWLCGAGARRGGGVSGIPGWLASRAVLEAMDWDRPVPHPASSHHGLLPRRHS